LLVFFLLLDCVCGLIEVQVTQTARDTQERWKAKPSVFFGSQVPNSNVKISIDPSVLYQEILGFGAAFTESSGFLFSTLSPTQQQQLLELYWGNEGINLTLGRIPIGSCDFSLSTYSYDDVDGDFGLSHFSIARDKQYTIPFIKAAIAKRGNIKFIGTPWSPPAWMKRNNNMLGSSVPCLKQDSRYHQAWANYLLKFVASYEEEEIPIWAITPQNEPEYNALWEACVYTPQEQQSFLKNYLIPTLRNSNYSHTNILIYDHNRDHLVDWANQILGDRDISPFLLGTAFHAYNGFLFDNVQAAHNLFPDKMLLATESARCKMFDDPWHWAERSASDIFGDLNAWAVGWMDWGLFVDTTGGPSHGNHCHSLVMLDRTNQKLEISDAYYLVGQIYRSIVPGSKRIGHTVNNADLQILTVLNPKNEVVVVVFNSNDVPYTVSLEYSGQSTESITVLQHSIVTLALKA